MDVKKTKKGKFSFVLDYLECEILRNELNDFIEGESTLLRTSHLNTQEVALRQLHLSVLIELAKRHYGKFYSPELTQRFAFTRAEALAIIIQLRVCRILFLQDLKSELHKLLS